MKDTCMVEISAVQLKEYNHILSLDGVLQTKQKQKTKDL